MHAYGSLLNSLYFFIVSWFFKQPSVSDKKKTRWQVGRKRRKEIECLQENLEETREKQPANSDCVGNKRCTVRK